MKILNYISKRIDRFIDKVGMISSYLIIILIILIFTSVFLRYLFSIGFVWLQDLYIWCHASVILLGIAFTLKNDGHVRIDLFYRNASKKYKNLINLLGYIFLSLPFCFLLIFKSYEYFHRSYLLLESSKETGGLPAVYILKFLIFFMGLTLLMQIVSQIIKIISSKKWK